MGRVSCTGSGAGSAAHLLVVVLGWSLDLAEAPRRRSLHLRHPRRSRRTGTRQRRSARPVRLRIPEAKGWLPTGLGAVWTSILGWEVPPPGVLREEAGWGRRLRG